MAAFDSKPNKKVGRPKADKPKTIRCHIRMDEETDNKLLRYCKARGITKSEACRRGIALLLQQADK